MHRRVFFLFLFSMLTLAAYGAAAATNETAELNKPGESVAVETLVSEIVRDNPEAGFYRSEIAAARAGRRTAAQWQNPEITAELGSKRVWDRSAGESLGDGPAWAVTVAQTLEWPGRMALRKAIAERDVAVAELGLEQFQSTLAWRARRLAYEALAADQRAEVAGQVSSRFAALLKVLVQRDSAGVTPLLEQRILEANQLTLYRRATQAVQERQSFLLQLNQLRGAPAAEPLKLSGSLTIPPEPPALPELLERAVTNNFDIRMRQLELAKQGFQMRLARHERYPAITLAPFYSSEKAADKERIAGVGVSVPLPIWNQNRGSVEAADARELQAEASLRAVVKRVEREVVENAMALDTKLLEMGHWSPESERQFREAAEVADRHYRLGAVPVTTYVEMQLRYLEAVEALLATRLEALNHRAELELLVATPLGQNGNP